MRHRQSEPGPCSQARATCPPQELNTQLLYRRAAQGRDEQEAQKQCHQPSGTLGTGITSTFLAREPGSAP